MGGCRCGCVACTVHTLVVGAGVGLLGGGGLLEGQAGTRGLADEAPLVGECLAFSAREHHLVEIVVLSLERNLDAFLGEALDNGVVDVVQTTHHLPAVLVFHSGVDEADGGQLKVRDGGSRGPEEGASECEEGKAATHVFLIWWAWGCCGNVVCRKGGGGHE